MTKQEMLSRQDELQQIYLKLFAERDELLVWSREMLTAIYTTSIGRLRMEIFHVQLKIKIMRSQIKLVHDLLYAGRKPIFDRIDSKIKNRFAEVDKQFAVQMEEVDRAYDEYLAPGAKQRDDELRKHFMSIAVLLLPDLFVNPSFEQRRMWEEAKETYAKRDMGKLKSLELICRNAPFPLPEAEESASSEELCGHVNRLEHLIDHLQSDLNVLRESYPFTMEHQLLNTKWVKQQQQVDTAELQKLKDRLYELEHEYETLKLTYGSD
ncbi:hypothetical protein [Olivibacter sitiensis]|uniref:hypothetical protein n=1 Tax=Olivibacter sitiensis TaxID=376470 RepID=UPI0003F4FF3E|nr:hypothetical protein [Olivibacter sitiensis]